MFDKTNHGRIALILAILLTIFIFFIQRDDEPTELIYNGKTVEISRHAACRMDCREITMSDVRAVLKNGKLNDKKSEPNAPRCPKFAIDGSTRNKEAMRIIVADCESEATLVTVIDLKNNYDCDCK